MIVHQATNAADPKKLCEASKAKVAGQYKSLTANTAESSLEDLELVFGRLSSNHIKKCTKDVQTKPPFREMLRGRCLLQEVTMHPKLEDIAESDETCDEAEGDQNEYSEDFEDGNDNTWANGEVYDEEEADEEEDYDEDARFDANENHEADVNYYDGFYGYEDEDDYLDVDKEHEVEVDYYVGYEDEDENEVEDEDYYDEDYQYEDREDDE